jgi:hypothetical protein
MLKGMFRRYQGGEEVGGGKYWNLYSGDYVVFAERGGILPTTEGEYVRAHPLLMLVAGPLMGLGYLLFLPIAVPVLLTQFAARRMRRMVAAASRAIGGG